MRRLGAVVLVLMGMLMCAGCEASSMTPDEVAAKTAEVWNAGMRDLAAIIRDMPEAALVREKVAKLREEVIQKMLKIGKARAKLDDAGIAASNSRLMNELWQLQQNEEFKANWDVMNQGHQHYAGIDERELGDAIRSFNIITQYAQLELLKRQEPEEAARLGIE